MILEMTFTNIQITRFERNRWQVEQGGVILYCWNKQLAAEDIELSTANIL